MKKTFIALAAILILANLYVRYTTKQDAPPDTVKTAALIAEDINKIEESAPFKVGDVVRMWGEEKGEVVLPEINLWAKPGGGPASPNQRVVGRLKHNTGVTIKGKEYVRGSWYFFIESPDYGPHGWVSELPLKK